MIVYKTIAQKENAEINVLASNVVYKNSSTFTKSRKRILLYLCVWWEDTL